MSATNLTPTQPDEIDAASLDTGQAVSAFGSSKILHRHLERLAIVYVRQSDPQQVLQHRESKELQYNLADRAVALGWPRERVLVIDEDQGQSAQSAASRHGFQRDIVGFLLNHDVRRLAREELIDRVRLAIDLDDIARRKLLAASRLDFAVKQHFAALNHQLGMAAGLRQASDLQELIQAERFRFLGVTVV